MTRKPIGESIELAFALSRRVHGRSERIHADQMQDVFAAFERQLVGVGVRRVAGDEAMVHVVVAVKGGADAAHVERLWYRHLHLHGLVADKAA